MLMLARTTTAFLYSVRARHGRSGHDPGPVRSQSVPDGNVSFTEK